MQFLLDFLAYFIFVNARSLVAIFATHAYNRLEILIQNQTVDGWTGRYMTTKDERLAMIVQRHIRILQVSYFLLALPMFLVSNIYVL